MFFCVHLKVLKWHKYTFLEQGHVSEQRDCQVEEVIVSRNQ